MATTQFVRRIISCGQLAPHRSVPIIVAALAAIPARAQNTGWLAQNCPLYVSPGQPYTNTATPGSQPARCFTCGQARKYAGDGTTINNPGKATELRPGPSPGVDNGRNYVYNVGNGYAGCRNRDDAQTLQINATELAEIRGWIFRIRGKNGEDEFEMDILPDLGWTPKAVVAPAPGGVTPINTLDRLAQLAMTPVNMIFAGAPTNYSQIRPPLVPSGGFPNIDNPANCLPSTCANLTYDQSAWGGAYSSVIHIEIDGWGSQRGYCDTLANGCSTMFGGKNWTDEYAPAGWFNDQLDTPNNTIVCSPATNCGHTWWPFNPWAFSVGQYVRIVGTLWKDGVHYDSAAELCWGGALNYIGWQEIHGVDYMEPAPAPNISAMHYVAGYSICMNANNAGPGGSTPPPSLHTAVNDSFQIGPQPQPGASLVIAARHFGPVINYALLDPPWQNAPNVSRAGTSVSASQGQNIWYANYNVSATVPYPNIGYLNEFIDTYWNTCGSGQCPDPNAPGGCAGISTATDPNNCGACAHQCEPSLSGNGAACFSGQCSFSCSPNYCPSSTDCVYTPGYTQCGASCSILSSDVNHCGSCSNQCSAGYTCNNGSCYQCNATTCPNGCCSSNVCYASGTSTGCVSSGNACGGACPSGDVCNGTACCVPIPQSTACAGRGCGTLAFDGCGHSYACSPCASGFVCGKCDPGVCYPRTAYCP